MGNGIKRDARRKAILENPGMVPYEEAATVLTPKQRGILREVGTAKTADGGIHCTGKSPRKE